MSDETPNVGGKKPRKSAKSRQGDDRETAAPEAAAVDALKVHPFMRHSKVRRVPRSSIFPAAYNPRQIDLNAKIKLKEGLREFGSVEPLIWNERNGNLVGGHQRLKLMDEEVNYPASGEDYAVDVSVVDLDPADEKILNVLLNNPNAQGWWDWQGLKTMMAEEKEFDAAKAGFDPVFLKQQFDAFTAPDDGLDLTHIFGAEKPDDAKADADKIAAMKATKDEYKAGSDVQNNADFSVFVVGRNSGEKEKFCTALGLSTYTKSIDLRDLIVRLGKMGLAIDIGWTPVADPVQSDTHNATGAPVPLDNPSPKEDQDGDDVPEDKRDAGEN